MIYAMGVQRRLGSGLCQSVDSCVWILEWVAGNKGQARQTHSFLLGYPEILFTIHEHRYSFQLSKKLCAPQPELVEW